MTREYRVERREPGEAHDRLLAARPAQRDDRGQKAQCADEGDQHAGAGDQAQLGHTGKVGRDKAQEPERGRYRGHQDLIAGADGVLAQRFARIGIFEPSLAVTNGELDGKIHRDADEQDAETHRDQIERANGRRGEQQRQHEAQSQRCQDWHDQTPGLHGKEQPERDQQQAADQAPDRPLHDRGEFLVRQRDLTGNADTRITRFHERQVGDDVAHRSGGLAARFERAVIELGLHQHEVVLAREVVQLAAAQQRLPR